MESILTSIKKLLGITEEYNHFDDDIIMHINSVFVTLNQLGVGPEEGYAIIDATDTWKEFLGTNQVLLSNVKTYTYLKVKQVFDPSLSSSVIESMNRQIIELEWRITAMVSTLADEEE